MADPRVQFYDLGFCERPMTATCALRGGRACAVCNLCYGCGRPICDACDSDQDLELRAFPGDSSPHPHRGRTYRMSREAGLCLLAALLGGCATKLSSVPL